MEMLLLKNMLLLNGNLTIITQVQKEKKYLAFYIASVKQSYLLKDISAFPQKNIITPSTLLQYAENIHLICYMVKD
jgi:hypothetical protein